MDGSNTIYSAFMKEERIRYLLGQYVGKTISAEELNELIKVMKQPEYRPVVEAFMNEQYEGLKMNKDVDVDWETMYQRVLSEKSGVKVYTMERRSTRKMWGWVAAAVVIFIVIGSWWLIQRKPGAGGQKPEVAKTNDVLPPKNTRAVIILSDGRKVFLDSAGNGIIAQEDNVNVERNENGEVVYKSKGSLPGEVGYNTFINPRGSRIVPLTLSDGSKVWLNSESSIKYPVAFNGNSRVVEITGEAYFEVTHNAAKPFIVSVNDMQVEVLGTHFNINSYSDEAVMKTTLLEGKVRVTRNGSIAVLKPGQQSVASLSDDHSSLTIANDVDVDQVMAWKNGKFSFDNADLKSIMRQLTRWYDVDVVYADNVPERFFTADISREKSLSGILKIFEESNIHFKIEGKKITVMP